MWLHNWIMVFCNFGILSTHKNKTKISSHDFHFLPLFLAVLVISYSWHVTVWSLLIHATTTSIWGHVWLLSNHYSIWLDSNRHTVHNEISAFLSGQTLDTNVTYSNSWIASDCSIFTIFAISLRGQKFNISVISRAYMYAFYELSLYLIN